MYIKIGRDILYNEGFEFDEDTGLQKAVNIREKFQLSSKLARIYIKREILLSQLISFSMMK